MSQLNSDLQLGKLLAKLHESIKVVNEEVVLVRELNLKMDLLSGKMPESPKTAIPCSKPKPEAEKELHVVRNVVLAGAASRRDIEFLFKYYEKAEGFEDSFVEKIVYIRKPTGKPADKVNVAKEVAWKNNQCFHYAFVGLTGKMGDCNIWDVGVALDVTRKDWCSTEERAAFGPAKDSEYLYNLSELSGGTHKLYDRGVFGKQRGMKGVPNEGTFKVRLYGSDHAARWEHDKLWHKFTFAPFLMSVPKDQDFGYGSRGRNKEVKGFDFWVESARCVPTKWSAFEIIEGRCDEGSCDHVVFRKREYCFRQC